MKNATSAKNWWPVAIAFGVAVGVLVYLLYYLDDAKVASAASVKIRILIALAILILAFGALLIWRLDQQDANLANILVDSNGKPSMARFQAMIFTFVVAIGIITLMAAGTGFPDIPNQILILLGGSGVTYLISKNIDANASGGSDTPQPGSNPTPTPPAAGFSGAAQPMTLFFGQNPATAIPAFQDPVVAQAALANQPPNPRRTVVLTAGVGDYGGWQVVAMVAGRTTVTVTCDNKSLIGEVRYPDRSGNDKTMPMQGGTITIDDLAIDRIAPIEAHLKGAAQAGPASVTVTSQ